MIPKLFTQLFETNSEITHKEILGSALSACVGILVLAAVSHWFVSGAQYLFLVASMGASAVLLFAAPASQMAQPWPLLGGHVVSALVGVSAYQFIPYSFLAPAVAMGLAIALMHYLRCLHPPGGATALLAVIGGEQIQNLGYIFVFTPILLNACLMLVLAIGINRYVLQREYPIAFKLKQHQHVHPEISNRIQPQPFLEEDLQSALQDLDTYIDISKEQLTEIFSLAQQHAQERKTKRIPCSQIMTSNVYSVEFATELEEMWQQMHDKNIKSAPVVDPANHVIGIVTMRDYLKQALSFSKEPLKIRMKKLIQRTPGLTAEKAEVAGQIMTSPVITAHHDQTVNEIVPLFIQHNIHHIPIVDGNDKLVGIVTRTDILSILEEDKTTPDYGESLKTGA
ncbi:HPP family protein [Kaarinaea lacus]